MFLSFLVLGLWAGSIYALTAFSLALTRRISGFVDFSQGAIIACAAYVALTLFKSLPINILNNVVGRAVVALTLTVIVASLLSLLLHLAVFRLFLRQSAKPLVPMIASLGLLLALENLLALIFGDRTLRIPLAQSPLPVVFGAELSPTQIASLLTCFVLTIAITLLLRSGPGRTIRAVANDPELAIVRGINVPQVRAWASVYAGCLAGFCGFFWACDNDLSPTMGFRPVLYGLVGATLAGFTGIPRAGLGALLVGVASYAVVIEFPTQWQDSLALAILVSALLLKPQGVLVRRTEGLPEKEAG